MQKMPLAVLGIHFWALLGAFGQEAEQKKQGDLPVDAMPNGKTPLPRWFFGGGSVKRNKQVRKREEHGQGRVRCAFLGSGSVGAKGCTADL
jgi:hypothetical protein